MAYRNKNLEKAIELLSVSSQYLKNSPNKGTREDKYRTTYELVRIIDDFIKSIERI